MELIDKLSAIFVDESEDLIYIYCLRDILIPEDSLGQDCVAGLFALRCFNNAAHVFAIINELCAMSKL